jgi:hypothetical protein
MTTSNFKNIGFYQTRLSEVDLHLVKNEISTIQSNFKNPLPIDMNSNLAGNIAREYSLSLECKNQLNIILQPHIKTYLLDNIKLLKYNKKIEFELDSCWVNFQKKYEFNPVHTHDGLLSFVIWINIPYTNEDELKNTSVKYSGYPVAGTFSFLYNTCLGYITEHIIPADKTYENTFLLFPSRLNHCVYPFYSSDDYRISVSGNFVEK